MAFLKSNNPGGRAGNPGQLEQNGKYTTLVCMQVRFLLLRTSSTNTSSTMEKEPIFTKCVSAGTRVYYMDAHSDKKGQPYISISEVPTRRNPGKKERRRIFVHLEDIPKFAEAFAKVAKYITDNTKDGTLALCN